MPKFQVTSPDGKSFEINAPDGSTPEQVLNYAQAQFKLQKAAPALLDPINAPGSMPTAPEAGLIAAGRSTDKIIQGIKQLGLNAIDDKAGLANQAAQQQSNDAAYAQLQKARPMATAIGETAPYLAVPGSASVPATAAITGAIAASKYGTPQERGQAALTDASGALIGSMLGKVAGKVIAPVSDNSQTRQAALEAANRIGYKPRMSELTGSRYAAALEDMAAQTPGGAGVMAEFTAKNNQALNRAAASSIGEAANEMTPRVFAKAADRLGKVFNEIKALPGKQIAINQNVATAADDVLRQANKMIPSQRDESLINLAEQAKALANTKGKIDGEAYQLARSGLSDAAFDATGTNSKLYGQLLRALDDSAEQSLKANGNEKLAEALRTVRPQYANLKTLEKGATAEGGNVSAARVASTLRTNNPSAFREGRMEGNPLYDISLIGESLKPLNQGSQTYARQTTSSLLDTLLKAPVAYAAAKATTSPVMTFIPEQLAKRPLLNEASKGAAAIANPTTRALAALLAQRAAFGAPVVAE